MEKLEKLTKTQLIDEIKILVEKEKEARLSIIKKLGDIAFLERKIEEYLEHEDMSVWVEMDARNKRYLKMRRRAGKTKSVSMEALETHGLLEALNNYEDIEDESAQNISLDSLQRNTIEYYVRHSFDGSGYTIEEALLNVNQKVSEFEEDDEDETL